MTTVASLFRAPLTARGRRTLWEQGAGAVPGTRIFSRGSQGETVYLTRKTGAVLGAAVLLAAVGALAAGPASAQSASQIWQTPPPGGPGPIVNVSSGQCLTQETAAGIGVPVAVLQGCTGAHEQHWEVTPGLGLIINQSSGQCLAQDTVAGSGVPVAVLKDCTKTGAQVWFTAPGGPGPIKNAGSNLYLTQDTATVLGLPIATLQPAG
jgi:hypothetical protein